MEKAIQTYPDDPQYLIDCKKLSPDEIIKKIEEMRVLYWMIQSQKLSITGQ